jgi:hypothetical protein
MVQPLYSPLPTVPDPGSICGIERLEEEIPLAGFMKPCPKYNAGYVKMYLQILGES